MASKPFPSGHLLAAADVNDLTGVINRNPTVVDVVSSTSETVVYFPSIAAGSLSTDRIARIVMGGDVLQNATATPTIKIYYGSAVLWQSVVAFPNDVDRRPWLVELWLQNINSASAQAFSGRISPGDPSAAAIGQGSQLSQAIIMGGTSAINSASVFGFGLTVQWDVNSASASFRKKLAYLELL